jgi:hypothetical protein
MSETPSIAVDAPTPHPIHLVVTDDLQRNRLTAVMLLTGRYPSFSDE